MMAAVVGRKARPVAIDEYPHSRWKKRLKTTTRP